MCRTLKQEVDTEEEEAALFDNTKWCKDTNLTHAEHTLSYG